MTMPIRSVTLALTLSLAALTMFPILAHAEGEAQSYQLRLVVELPAGQAEREVYAKFGRNPATFPLLAEGTTRYSLEATTDTWGGAVYLVLGGREERHDLLTWAATAGTRTTVVVSYTANDIGGLELLGMRQQPGFAPTISEATPSDDADPLSNDALFAPTNPPSTIGSNAPGGIDDTRPAGFGTSSPPPTATPHLSLTATITATMSVSATSVITATPPLTVTQGNTLRQHSATTQLASLLRGLLVVAGLIIALIGGVVLWHKRQDT